MKKSASSFILILSIILIHSLTLNSQTWQVMYDSTQHYIEQGNYLIARNFAEKALTLATDKSSAEYRKSISQLVDIYYLVDVLKSLEYARIDSADKQKLFGSQSVEFAMALINLARVYTNYAEYELAEKLLGNSKRIILKTSGEKSVQYAINKARSGVNFYFSRNYQAADSCFRISKNLLTKYQKNNTEIIFEMIQCELWIQLQKSDLEKAKQLNQEAEKLFESGYDKDHYLFSRTLMFQGIESGMNNNHKEAGTLYKKALELFNKTVGDESFLTRWCNEALIINYISLGLYQDARNLCNKNLDLIKRKFGEDHPKYINHLSHLGAILYYQGDYIESLKIAKRSSVYFKNKYSEENVYYLESISRIAIMLQNLGRIEEAIEFAKDAQNRFKNLFGQRHPSVARQFATLGGLYQELKRYKEAEKYYDSAAVIFKETIGEENDFALYLNMIRGLNYIYLGDYDSAEKTIQKGLKTAREIHGKDSDIYAATLSCIGFLHMKKEDYYTAETYYTQSLEISKKNDVESHYRNIVSDAALLYLEMDSYEEANSKFSEMIDMTIDLVHKFFPHLPERHKLDYWNKEKYFVETYYNFVSRFYENQPEITGRMYDIGVATKGIVVDSKKKALHQARTMQRTLEQFRQTSDLWVNLIQNPGKAESLGYDLDSLESVKFELETKISSVSSAFRRTFDTTRVSWKDIQKKLAEGEAAVEIVSFRKYHKELTDTIVYAALIIKKDSEYPELVVLENGNDLEDKFIKEYKSDLTSSKNKKFNTFSRPSKSFEHYWEAINNRLQGIKTVYLAPDGVYNQINLNTLYNPITKKYVLEEKDIRLLTNTKDLVELEKYYTESTSNDAFLVGDPAFNLPGNPQTGGEPDYYLSRLFHNISERGLSPLPGTKKEIENISKNLEYSKWQVEDRLGAQALESSLKKNKGARIIHLATHGVFLKDVEQIREMIGPSMQQQAYVENPLLRSMLLFAGAENTIKGQNIDDVDDGILTAYEVMNLDLDNTELVVLSACETGLGEVKNGEGVYGMQRAFQIAGAKTLIMSLWTVNDQTTQELMTSFYDKWLSSMSKREAFREAQLELKEKYPGFYNWGAFVMVGE